MPNTYSQHWFRTFAATIEQCQTQREVEFIKRHLPLPAFRHVLDICCGSGRHAIALAHDKYQVLGIDTNAQAIDAARASATASVAFLVHDMQRVRDLGQFDGVICMWQSFGHFDAETNASVLRQIAASLRAAGRLILDIYNRDFFEQHHGTRSLERDGQSITETKCMKGDRLTVRLDYTDNTSDQFEWQVFTLSQIRILAEACGFRFVVGCRDFDENAAPHRDKPRMQLVLERTSAR